MRRRLIATSTALLALAGALIAQPAAAATAPKWPVAPRVNTTLRNWAGYIAETPTPQLTDVYGDFIVPAVTCTSTDSYASTWLGLGGYHANDTLFQGGVDEDCFGGVATYQAFTETVTPGAQSSSTQDFLPGPVNPGDHIVVSIGYGMDTQAGQVQPVVVNYGRSWSLNNTATYQGNIYYTHATGSYTAECIQEAPTPTGGSQNQAKYGTVTFPNVPSAPTTAYAPGCGTEFAAKPIGQDRNIPQKGQTAPKGTTFIHINMTEPGRTLAATSLPSATGSFTVTYRNAH